jgi:5-formyltetrahydrofolate cyclo-ligase
MNYTPFFSHFLDIESSLTNSRKEIHYNWYCPTGRRAAHTRGAGAFNFKGGVSLMDSGQTVAEINQNQRISMKKAALAVPPDISLKNSIEICERMSGLRAWARSRALLCYMPVKAEPDCRSLIKKAWSADKQVILPACRPDRGLDLYAITHFNQTAPGHFGLREPLPGLCGPSVPPDILDLVIVPGVAFDPAGQRLGRGEGYFDRFLSQLRPDIPIVALAFDFQILKVLPHEPHDQPVHQIVTETRHICCDPANALHP